MAEMICGTPQSERDSFLAEARAERLRDYAPMFDFRGETPLRLVTSPHPGSASVVARSGFSSPGERASAIKASPAGEPIARSLEHVQCARCSDPAVAELCGEYFCLRCAGVEYTAVMEMGV